MKNYFLMTFVVAGLIFVSSSFVLADTMVLTPVKEDPKVEDTQTEENTTKEIPVVEGKTAVPPTVSPVVESLKEEEKKTEPKPEPDTLVRDAITGKKIERVNPIQQPKKKESLRDSVRSKLKE